MRRPADHRRRKSTALVWDGERLFQAGRFTNEMEYQHLVFEEFGRMMQPDIDAFVFEPSADINPTSPPNSPTWSIASATRCCARTSPASPSTRTAIPFRTTSTLFEGFLNPVEFASAGDADAAAGAIIRGMTRQTGSEIDEFVTDVLRNQLLGIPLDLATINLARGRDVGTPSLNAAREKFYDETGDTLLKPYESWADFALNLKNPASIINFIAAYGTHAALSTEAVEHRRGKARRAAPCCVLGGTPAQALPTASTSSMPPAPMPAARWAGSTPSTSGSAAWPKRRCPSAACWAPPSASSSR